MLKVVQKVAINVALAAAILVIGASAHAGASSPRLVTEIQQSPRFEIVRYEVSGNTLLHLDDMDRAFAPYVGKNKNFADVQRALEALQGLYEAHGYGSVQVVMPEQELEQGAVKFVVVESRVAGVRIEGNKHRAEQNVLRSLPALRKGEIPNTNAIAAGVKLANENPSRKVAVRFNETEQEGELDATVKVTDSKPWSVGLAVDNTGTRETGHFRVSAGAQYANLFDLDHVLSVQYQTSTGQFSDDIKVLAASYHIPLYAIGDSIDLMTMVSKASAPGTAGINALIPGLSTVGNGSAYMFRYNHALPKRGTYEHKLSMGLDYRLFRSDATSSFGALGGVDVALRPVSLTYAGFWQSEEQQLSFQMGAAANIEGARHGSESDIRAAITPPKNAYANADYRILRYGIDYSRVLPKEWQLHLALDGQYTNDVLVSYENFGMGGSQSVRGFNERELTGDKGVRGSIELITPDVGGRVGEGVNLRGLVFVDAGRIMFNHPNATDFDESVVSVGAGIRLGIKKAWSVRADLAQAVDGNGHPATGAHFTRTGDLFLHVAVGYLF